MVTTCRIRLFVGAEVVNWLQVIIKMRENYKINKEEAACIKGNTI